MRLILWILEQGKRIRFLKDSFADSIRYFETVIYSIRNETLSTCDAQKEDKDRPLLWAELYFKSIFLRPNLVPQPFKSICAVILEVCEKLGYFTV